MAKYNNLENMSQMSPIWRAIAALNEIGQVSCNMKVGNGLNTKFQLDRFLTIS
jgi:hypothetical protein